MAYKITQHRRGTLAEWESLNPIALDGELIIIEFDNNVRKCKIGDGETPFSELPYTTDALAAELLNEIGLVREQISDNLAAAIADVTLNIDTAIARLNQDVNTLDKKLDGQVASVTTDINEVSSRVADIEVIVGEGIKSDINSLSTLYSNSLNEITTQHAADVETLTSAIETLENKLTDKVDLTAEQTKIAIREELATSAANLADDYNEKITNVTSRISTVERSSDKHGTDIYDLQVAVSGLDADLDSRLTAKILESESATKTSIDNILAELSNINQILEELKVESDKGPAVDVPSLDTNVQMR